MSVTLSGQLSALPMLLRYGGWNARWIKRVKPIRPGLPERIAFRTLAKSIGWPASLSSLTCGVDGRFIKILAKIAFDF